MNWQSASYIAGGIFLTSAAAYAALRIRAARSGPKIPNKEFDFRPSIGFAKQDGYQSVAVILENESEEFVWTEEVEIALTELVATTQTAEATCREVRKVRQSIRPHDMLPVSLVESIYKAAGGPQRKYSCVMSSVVRYRIGEKWYQEPMKTYRLNMTGLTISSLKHVRTAAVQFAQKDMSEVTPRVNAMSR